MLVLKRLKINRYRNVVPGTELRFDAGINLILGQNASGKTTLLTLLSAVCRSAFDQIEDEEFELEYELQNDRFTVIADISHRPLPMGVYASNARPTGDDEYKITITDRISQQRLVLESLSAAFRLTLNSSFIGAELRLRNDEVFGELGTALLHESNSTYRFDESIDCFMIITGRPTSTSASPSAPRVYMVIVDDRVHSNFVPTDLAYTIEQAWCTAQNAPLHLKLDLGGETDLERRLADALDVKRLRIELNVSEIANGENGRILRAEGFKFEIERADGTVRSHDKLSYGEKRMLAFFYYLAGNPSAVIADELVNGLHHKWIDRCMESLRGRQAFLTSQNPVLFDYVEFDSPAMVERCFITCKLERIDGRDQMRWENMSAVDAKRFYDEYEVGIMHVGEILKIKGLW